MRDLERRLGPCCRESRVRADRRGALLGRRVCVIVRQSEMTKLSVLLMQLPVPNNPATNVPLAAGYLKAYAQAQGLLERVAIDILPRALADSAGDALLVEAITAHKPDVLGISLYTWNSERSLDIARRVRARLPGLLVVV